MEKTIIIVLTKCKCVSKQIVVMTQNTHTLTNKQLLKQVPCISTPHIKPSTHDEQTRAHTQTQTPISHLTNMW